MSDETTTYAQDLVGSHYDATDGSSTGTVFDNLGWGEMAQLLATTDKLVGKGGDTLRDAIYLLVHKRIAIQTMLADVALQHLMKNSDD